MKTQKRKSLGKRIDGFVTVMTQCVKLVSETGFPLKTCDPKKMRKVAGVLKMLKKLWVVPVVLSAQAAFLSGKVAWADEEVTLPTPSTEGAPPSNPGREGMAPPWETAGKPPSEQPQTAVPGKTLVAHAEAASSDPLKIFINIGVGFGYVSYDPYYSAISSSQVYLNGQGYPIASDEGFYLSLISPNTLTGLVARGVTDLHLGGSASSGFSSSSTTAPFIFQGNLAASLIQFFGADQASGFYVRGDAGYAVVGIGAGANFFSLSGTQSGVGLLGGLGYAIKLGKHVRMLLGGQATTILFLPDSPLSTFQGDASILLAF